MANPPYWEPIIIEGLAELWEHYPCLYDVTSPFYRDRNARRTALEEIITKLHLDVTVDQVKAKLKNLRTQYVKVKAIHDARVRRNLPTPRWRYMNLLAFLEPHVSTRNSASDQALTLNFHDDGFMNVKLEEEEEYEDTVDPGLDVYECVDDTTQNDSLPDDDDSVVSSVSTPAATSPPTPAITTTATAPSTTSTSTTQPTPPRDVVRPLKRPRTETFENEMLKKGIETLEKAYKRFSYEPWKKVEDEYDVFGKHVANELREISNPNARRYAKLQIQQVLYTSQVEGNAPLQPCSSTDANVIVPHNP